MGAIQKVRAGQDRHQAFLYTVVEAATFAAFAVELHGAGEVFIGDGATECLVGNSGEDAPRTIEFLTWLRWITLKNPLARSGRADTDRVVGTTDSKVVDTRPAGNTLHQHGHAIDRHKAVQGLDGFCR